MKRRTFLKMSIPLAAATFALPACKRIEGSVEKPVLPLILRGGRVFYNNRWQTMDVGIDGAGKLRLAGDLRGVETIDVTGRVVSPGFIDILADNSTEPENTFHIFEKYKITDGVTTALQMHGGSANCGAYYRHFAGVPHAINYGVSTFVMAIRALGAALQNIQSLFSNRTLHVERRQEKQGGASFV